MRAGVACLLALLGIACGGGSSRSGGDRAPLVAVGVAVSFDRNVDPLPFDPRGERLRAAFARLAEIAGHTVAFRFDVALLPEYRSGFEDALVEAAEHAARDLRTLSERQREVFERAAPLLERIECRYDAAATDESAVFEPTAKTVKVALPPRASDLLPAGLLHRALDEEHDRYVENRFGGARPGGLTVAEHAAYFRFLTGYRRHGPKRADLGKPEGYVNDPEAEEILRGIELYSLSRDADLRSQIGHWLVGRGDYFTAAYLHHPGLVEQAPPGGSFHVAEAAWVRWLPSALPGLPDRDRLTATKTVFVRMFNSYEDQYGRFARFAFPGFDPFAYGLGIIDEWRMAGYPIELPDRPERAQLYEHVVCPHPVSERGSRSRAPRCDYDWYEFALASPSGRARLVRAVLERRDPYLTETVVVNVGYKGGLERLIELWRAVERDEATWRVATRVIADDFAETSGGPLVDESRRLFRSHPGRRGALLYVLAQVDRYGHGKVPWKDFPSAFGAAISAADFSAFLDEGARALSIAHIVWPGLSPGWSRARPIADRLDRFLDDPLVRQYNFQDPWSALRAIVNRLCSEKAREDLAVLHAAFQERSRRKPSEARPWENLIVDTAPGACR